MVLDELFVTKQHAIFAVNRHHKLRPHGFRHDANVFLRRVTTDVNQPASLFDDIRALLVQETNELGNRPFIARDDARRQDHRVAFFDRQAFVDLRRHLIERRARFGLRTSNEEDDFMIRHHLRLVDVDQHPVVYVEIAEPIGNLNILLHRSTKHADLAIELLGNVKDDLQAMNGRGECGHDDSPLRFRKDFFESRNDCAL
jgi:hypothetical protein